MRGAVEGKVQKVVDKLGSGRVTSCQVILRIDGGRDDTKNSHGDGLVTEVVCNMKGGGSIKSRSSTDDMYASIDLAAHSLAQNLKRHISKLKDHKSARMRTSVGGNVAEDEINEDLALLEFDEESLLTNLNPKYRA